VGLPGFIPRRFLIGPGLGLDVGLPGFMPLRLVFCFLDFLRYDFGATLVFAEATFALTFGLATFAIFGAGFVAGFVDLTVAFVAVFTVFDCVAAMAVPVKRKAAAVIDAISLFKIVLLLSVKVAPDFQTEAGQGCNVSPTRKVPLVGRN
jgi:hypothetical protein